MELSANYLIPEIILLAMACFVTLLGLSPKDSVRKMTQTLAAVALFVALLVALVNGDYVPAALEGILQPLAAIGIFKFPANAFPHALFFSPNYITILSCVIGFLSVLASWNMPAKADPSIVDSNYRGEFFGMLLFSIAGVAMIGKVNDLIWLFIALELVSIPTYILVATGRSQIMAQEAGVKYFFLGALSAAIFLVWFFVHLWRNRSDAVRRDSRILPDA